MAEHGIELVELVHALGDVVYGNAKLVRQFTLLRTIVGQKFMERRIEKPDRRRQTL